MLEPKHDPDDARGQHLCRFAAELAAANGVSKIECVADARGGGFYACRREGATRPTVHLDLKWLDYNRSIRVCTCGHTHRLLGDNNPRASCTWPGCDCQAFNDDSVPQDERLTRIAEAIVAHEVGHLLQEHEGQPTKGRAAQLDADVRAARLVGVERVIESIVFTDWVSHAPTYDNPSGPERVEHLRAVFRY